MTNYEFLQNNKIYLAKLLVDTSFYRQHSGDSGTYYFDERTFYERSDCIKYVVNWLDNERSEEQWKI